MSVIRLRSPLGPIVRQPPMCDRIYKLCTMCDYITPLSNSGPTVAAPLFLDKSCMDLALLWSHIAHCDSSFTTNSSSVNLKNTHVRLMRVSLLSRCCHWILPSTLQIHMLTATETRWLQQTSDLCGCVLVLFEYINIRKPCRPITEHTFYGCNPQWCTNYDVL